MTGVSATWMPLSGHLAADEAGSDDAPRFVFLHGFAQTRESWKPIAERLVDHGATCVVIDLPGHGGSGSVRADLRRTADMAVEIGHRATWVGYSLGGRAALHVALMYPHLVRSLVLIGANPGIDDEETGMSVNMNFLQELLSGIVSRGRHRTKEPATPTESLAALAQACETLMQPGGEASRILDEVRAAAA